VVSAAGPGLPTGALDLLAKAALAPPDVARPAWSEWRRGYGLDETPWNEVRMLGAIAPRLKWLEADASIAPRILGIRKFLYVQTQTCLLGAMEGLRALASAPIPIMLLKGVARIVRDPAAAQERLVRDVDVLVPIDRKTQALAILREAGWTFSADGQWQNLWHDMDDTASHHAWAVAKGNAQIDLHHFSNHLNRLIGDDDGLWRRATTMDWRGMQVFVPSATDNLIACVVHGLRWSRDRNADWAIDACASIDSGAIDWDVLVADVRNRMLDAILVTGLRYMKDVLDKPVPAEVLQGLEETARPEQWSELEYYAAAPIPRNDVDHATALEMAMARCFGNSRANTSGPSPARKFFLSLRAQQLPIERKLSVRQFHGAIGTLGLELELDLDVELPAGARIIAALGIMGLLLDRGIGTVAASATGRPHCKIDLSVHSRLLERRGISNLAIVAGVARPTSGRNMK